MKRKLLLTILSVVLLVSCLTGLALSAYAAESDWSGDGVTVAAGELGGTLVTNATGEEHGVTYAQEVDFVKGAKVSVAFMDESYFPLHVENNEPTAFLNDTDYLKFTALQNGKGVEVKVYAMYANNDGRAIAKAKMLVEVTYLDGEKRDYAESFETYVNVHSQIHSMQIRKEGDFLYVSFDDLTAVPVAKYASLDLSAATLTVSSKNAASSHKYEIIGVSDKDLTSFIYHDEWGTLGATKVTENADGTTVYDIKDGRMGQYNGSEARVRENLVNVKGFDVTKPIVIEAQYEIVNTMAVWWAIALGETPYGNLDRMVYYLEQDGEHARGDLKKSYGSNNMTSDYGVMFQTVSGMAQPQIEQNTVAYVTRAGAGGYKDRSNLDTIVIEIGEEGTKWTYNNTVLFESIQPKRSDFKSGKVYPYFHFIGTPANPNKENKVVVKGVNAPKITDAENSYSYLVGSSDPVVVGLENYENVNGALALYYDGACTQAVDASQYEYDAAEKKLTVKSGAFASFSAGQNTLFAKNDGGSEQINILVRDAGEATVPPEVEKETYYYKKGDTADLEIKVDIHNGTFQKVNGGGLSSSRYTFVAPEGDSTVGTIVISGEKFLSGKDYGELKFTVYTVDIYGETYTDVFYVNIVDKLPDEGGKPDDGDGDQGNGGGKGCGGVAAAISLPAAALAIAGAAFALLRKK